MNQSDSNSLKAGEVFADKYEIIRLLGKGGMGEVYLARDQFLDVEVALKLLTFEDQVNEVASQRFLREVLLTREVSSPVVVKTFDASIYKDQLFFVMEYIDGVSLKERIQKNDLSLDHVVEILKDLCIGLKSIHEAGIVHRDLKPANIMLTDSGKVKITDFGVATPGRSDITTVDEVIGSCLYMSPEAWRGKDVTSASDIYALGVILYEMLTGVLPFDGETSAQIMYKHLEGQLVPPANIVEEVPNWLNNLTQDLLASDYNLRPTLDEILEFISSDSPIDSKGITRPGKRFTEPREQAEPVSSPAKTGYENTATEVDDDIWAVSKEASFGNTSLKEKKIVNPKFGKENIKEGKWTFKIAKIFNSFNLAALNYKTLIASLIVFALLLAALLFPLADVIKDQLKSLLATESKSVYLKLAIYFITAIYYSLIAAVPFGLLASFYNNFRTVIRKYFYGVITCCVILFLFSFVYASALGYYVSQVRDVNISLLTSSLNLSLPRVVNNLIEAALFFPAGNFYTPGMSNILPTLLPTKLGLNPYCLVYFLILCLYVQALVSFNKVDFRLPTKKFFMLNKTVLIFILFLVFQYLVYLLAVNYGLIELASQEYQLATSSIKLNPHFLYLAPINWALFIALMLTARRFLKQ